MTASTIEDRLHITSESIEIVSHRWLIATGGSDSLEVFRSPLVRDDDEDYLPIKQFINDHGLVLATRETFDDDYWVFATVEVSVYVRPAA